jgi:hypothetical protein
VLLFNFSNSSAQSQTLIQKVFNLSNLLISLPRSFLTFSFVFCNSLRLPPLFASFSAPILGDFYTMAKLSKAAKDAADAVAGKASEQRR